VEAEPNRWFLTGRRTMNPFLSPCSARGRALRAAWHCIWLVLFRPTPKMMHGWRSMLLRMFGARVGRGAHAYPGCKIWAPWNLVLGDYACLGPDVDCYNVALIELGEYAMQQFRNTRTCAGRPTITRSRRCHSFPSRFASGLGRGWRQTRSWGQGSRWRKARWWAPAHA